MKLPRTATILHLIATGLSIVCNASGSPAVESSGIQSSNAYIGEARTSSTKAKALPRGFESYNDPNGTGRLIFEKKSSGSTSAIATMRQFLSSLKGSFDGPMKIVAATGDPKDTIVQAMLTIQIGGQPVQAVASVAVNQGSSIAGLIYDRPSALRTSYSRLSSYFSKQIGQPAEGSQGSAAPDPSTWQRQSAGDGSAYVSIPPSWKVASSAKGSIGLQGPNHEEVLLGFQTFVTPGSKIYAPYMAPEQALGWFTRLQGIQLLRVLDRAPVSQASAGQKAELITAEFQHGGSTIKAKAMVRTTPMAMNNWGFQISMVAAPEGEFEAAYPTMASIWNSWSLDPKYVASSFAHAEQVSAQTRQMMMEGAQRSMHAFDNINEAWDQTIRGVSTMENTSTGQRGETQIGTEQQVLHACQAKGLSCRQVPTDELVQPQ